MTRPAEMPNEPTEIIEKFGGSPHSKHSLRLWLRMLGCCSRIESVIRDRLRREFATTLPRFDVMAALDRNPEGLTMGELSRFLMVSNGNTTGVVNRLESDGLIRRRLLPTDRRTHTVKLTSKGRKLFKTMAETHEGWIDELFAEVSLDEAEVLLRQLERVQYSLARHGAAKETT